jgi:hypothetical protein
VLFLFTSQRKNAVGGFALVVLSALRGVSLWWNLRRLQHQTLAMLPASVLSYPYPEEIFFPHPWNDLGLLVYPSSSCLYTLLWGSAWPARLRATG